VRESEKVAGPYGQRDPEAKQAATRYRADDPREHQKPTSKDPPGKTLERAFTRHYYFPQRNRRKSSKRNFAAHCETG
jgi:hypothetical protein